MPLFHKSSGKNQPKKLKRVGYGAVDEKTKGHTDYAEEAVVLVWQESWRGLKLHGSGHAAMKLKKLDPSKGKVSLCDYVSWWPGGGAEKKTPKQKGMLSPKYSEDQKNEIPFPIQVSMFLGFLWEALAESPTDRLQVFQEVWKQSEELDKVHNLGLIARYTELGFSEDFDNFETLKGTVKERGDQKRLKESNKVFKFDWKGSLFQGANHAKMAKLAVTKARYGKRPFAKIYLPCSTLPAVDGGNAQVWGLSLDAMRCSWQAFSSNFDPQYEMQSHDINCVGVVWHRLIDGYGDFFQNFKKTFSLPNMLRSVVSYIPSDLISVGEALDKVFAKMNEQQKFINGLAVANRGAVLKKFGELKGWRQILTSEAWKKLSAGQGSSSRSVDLSALDKAVGKYESARKEMSLKEERKLIETILDDFEKLRKLKRKEAKVTKKLEELEKEIGAKTEKYRGKAEHASTAEKIDKYMDILAQLAARQDRKSAKRSKDLRRDQEEMTLALIQANLGFLTAPRRKMVPHLITIHNEVYKFARAHKKDPCLPAVLLLGQCAAYAYWEVAHFGKHITNCVAAEDEAEVLMLAVDSYLVDVKAIIKPTQEATASLKQTLEELEVKDTKEAFAQFQHLNLDSVLKSKGKTTTTKTKEKLKIEKKGEWCEEHNFPLYECPYC